MFSKILAFLQLKIENDKIMFVRYMIEIGTTKFRQSLIIITMKSKIVVVVNMIAK